MCRLAVFCSILVVVWAAPHEHHEEGHHHEESHHREMEHERHSEESESSKMPIYIRSPYYKIDATKVNFINPNPISVEAEGYASPISRYIALGYNGYPITKSAVAATIPYAKSSVSSYQSTVVHNNPNDFRSYYTPYSAYYPVNYRSISYVPTTYSANVWPSLDSVYTYPSDVGVKSSIPVICPTEYMVQNGIQCPIS